MNITRKIVLTGVVALAVFALGSAGAAAVAHTLTIEDRTGAVQKTSPVTTGTTDPSPNALAYDDKSVDATGTTTVPPVDPMYVDEYGDVRHNGAEDGVAHGATHDSSTHDSSTHDSGDTGMSDAPSPSPSPSQGTTGSPGSVSTSDGSAESGSSSGSGDGGGSNDTGEHR